MREKRELPRVGLLRRSARDVLAVQENRLILIEAQVLLLLFVALYITLSQTFWALQSMLAAISGMDLTIPLFAVYLVALTLLAVLLLLPAVIGFLRLAGRMERGERVVLSELFGVFSDKGLYQWAKRISRRWFWRIALTVTVIEVTVSLSSSLFAGSLLAALICSGIVILELIGGLWLILKDFSMLAGCLFPEDFGRARTSAHRRSVRSALHFIVGFLPWLLLGVLSFGILLLWEVLPCMAISYFGYCRELKDQNLNIHSEE